MAVFRTFGHFDEEGVGVFEGLGHAFDAGLEEREVLRGGGGGAVLDWRVVGLLLLLVWRGGLRWWWGVALGFFAGGGGCGGGDELEQFEGVGGFGGGGGDAEEVAGGEGDLWRGVSGGLCWCGSRSCLVASEAFSLVHGHGE